MGRLVISALLSCALCAPAWGMCFKEVSERSGIPEQLLRVIAEVESSMNPRAINVNANGSEDIGLMQINSGAFHELKKRGINRADLFDPCINVSVGAWILSQKIDRYGFTWEAVGAYNAKSRDKRDRYIARVYAKYKNKRKQIDGLS